MRCLALLFFAFVLPLFPSVSRATAQEPDIIIIEGKKLNLNTNPLSSYLQKNPDALPKTSYQRTSNWRGYTATWSINDGLLFLNNVEMRFPNEDKSSREALVKDVLAEIFPPPHPVYASWYTGTLIIPDGKQVEYVHMGYGSTYSHYQIFRVRDGKVLEHLSLNQKNFEDYRVTKFKQYMRTKDFKSAFADLKKTVGKSMTDEQVLQFMAGFYAEQYLAR